eukprot:14775-Rhodomonas_salina.2
MGEASGSIAKTVLPVDSGQAAWGSPRGTESGISRRKTHVVSTPDRACQFWAQGSGVRKWAMLPGYPPGTPRYPGSRVGIPRVRLRCYPGLFSKVAELNTTSFPTWPASTASGELFELSRRHSSPARQRGRKRLGDAQSNPALCLFAALVPCSLAARDVRKCACALAFRGFRTLESLCQRSARRRSARC